MTPRDWLLADAIPDDATPTIRQIQDEVCIKHNISRVDLLSDRRVRRITIPRQEGYWRAARETLASLTCIARAFHRVDHTTILNGIRRHEMRMTRVAGIG